MEESLFPAESQAFLKALASETRQHIVQVVASGDALTVGEIAERCGIAYSTASEQLTILKAGGLVSSVRHGKTVSYRADSARIGAQLKVLSTFLTRCCPSPADAED